MDVEQILGLIAQATNTVRDIATTVNNARETLNDNDGDRVDAALQALRQENDRLAETVAAKLAAASKQG
jgi:hypothetical protein